MLAPGSPRLDGVEAFDAIHCGAAAEAEDGAAVHGMLALLAPGGRLVCPVGAAGTIQWLTVFDRLPPTASAIGPASNTREEGSVSQRAGPRILAPKGLNFCVAVMRALPVTFVPLCPLEEQLDDARGVHLPFGGDTTLGSNAEPCTSVERAGGKRGVIEVPGGRIIALVAALAILLRCLALLGIDLLSILGGVLPNVKFESR
jgi:hypothetical protein